MSFIRRVFNITLLLLLSNIVMLTAILKYNPAINFAIITALTVFFIVFNITPVKGRKASRKLKILIGGYELLISTVFIFTAEILISLYIYLFSEIAVSPITLIINAAVGLTVIMAMVWNGIIRVMCTSRQIGLLLRILLLVAWWIPLLNILVLSKCCSIVRREYIFESSKIELDTIRKDSEICKTKYPILLVHGIFWRDWQLFNYWGRIPGELIRNGSTVYYGNQQSAAPMEVSANELKNQILNIIDKEKCEKVNVIAHSKGGLDARYAISCLGMDKFV